MVQITVSASPRTPEQLAEDKAKRDQICRDLWLQLHRRPLEADLSSHAGIAAERRWLMGFEMRVPCGECKQHWRTWTSVYPPDLRSIETYCRWTWIAQNAVNRLRDVQGMTLADAAQTYGWPAGTNDARTAPEGRSSV